MNRFRPQTQSIPFGWVARDKDGFVGFYNIKPSMGDGEFFPENNDHIAIQPNSFPSLTFENSPKRVRLILEDD